MNYHVFGEGDILQPSSPIIVVGAEGVQVRDFVKAARIKK